MGEEEEAGGKLEKKISSPSAAAAAAANGKRRLQKSYFDVLGICCTSEVPLVERILKPLNGVHKVSVVVPSKTVIVVHDNLLVSQLDIVKALNQARLEATIRAYGSAKIAQRWPSPFVLACGVLLVISLFKHFFHPLRWFAVAAVLVGIKPIVFRGVAAVRRLTLDINILIIIAVGGAIALQDYSEAAFIVFLFTVAEWLESRASHKAIAGMSSLMSMAPQKAVLAETGQVVDVEEVKVNTMIAVKAGEVIPIDGIVVDGQSEVDERSLTGESFPIAKQANSLVWAGTLNIDGYISVRTTALSENSAVAKMTRLVEEAQNSRSSTQRLIDTWTKYYTPAVVIVAATVALVPLLRVKNPRSWFQLALVLLVSACPCSLVLSTPVATFCALLKAARIGLLIKGGDVLEALAKIRVVAFDKTGTITKGEFTVVEIQSVSSTITLHEILCWVSSIESKSSHPMAAAFVDHARSYSIEPKPDCVKEFHIYPGEGIYGEIDGRNIYVGNKKIAARASCETVPNMENMKEGVTFVYAFIDMAPAASYALADTCRTGAAEAIKELKSLGIKTAMLTGDSREAAMHAQRQLNHDIEEVHAELLPEDKVNLIGELKSREGYTAMVGDGMNDAPALALANVGISMGISGSAVASESSHISLMSNDIGKIPKVIRLARKTRRKVVVNIIFSVVTKVAIMAIAFAGHPLIWAAVLADVGTCLIVILNSMMLLQAKTSSKKKCCGSSHKRKHKKAEHCAEGACGQPSTCHQLNILRRQNKRGCHDHRKACMNQDHPEESPDHSHHSLGCQNKHHCHDHKAKDEIIHAHCMNHDHQVNALNHSHYSPGCQNKHGCDDQKKAKDENKHDHCMNQDHHAESLSHSNNSLRCQNKHGRHDHKGKDERMHDLCMNQDHQAESHDHQHCRQASDTSSINSTQEHLISITDVGHCCTNLTCSQPTDHVKDGPSSNMAYENQTNQRSVTCSVINENKCVRRGCSTSHKSDGYCMTNETSCGSERGCSTSQSLPGRRKLGGCCRSYRKACAKAEGCCESERVKLPEIITE